MTWAERGTALAGALGWGAATILAATVVVGRTGPVPSTRWLLAAAFALVALGAVAWLAGPPLQSRRPGKAGARPLATRAAGAHSLAVRAASGLALLLPALALLATCLPLLPVLYVDDDAYHRTGGGAASGRWLLLYLLALALAGGLWRRGAAALRAVPAPPDGVGPAGAGAVEGAAPVASARRAVPPPVPVLAVALMLLANYGLFGALQGHIPPDPSTLLTLAANLTLGALGAYLGGRAAGASALGAVALWGAWLAFAPWRETLATDVRPALALALGAGALALLAHDRYPAQGDSWRGIPVDVAPGMLLGLLGVLVPPALAAIPALAILGRGRAALAGATVAAAGALFLWLMPGVTPVPRVELIPAVGGTPHLQNAALGAFHARLFSGPEALAAQVQTPPPYSAPAAALNAGALLIGAWLVGGLLWIARGAGGTAIVGAVCLAMVAGTLLAGTAPRDQLAPAMLALVPLTGAAFRPVSWGRAEDRPWPAGALAPFLGTAVAGYLLAGTSIPALATAGAPVLSAWPPLASPPTLGVVLLTLLLALLLTPRTREP